MIDYSLISSLGLNPNDGRMASNGRYLTFNCPRCVERGEPRPDRKHRLHVCIETMSGKFGTFHCFRCGYAGRVQKGGIEFDGSLLRNRRISFESNRTIAHEAKLPADFSRISRDMHAYDYLIKRGITEDDIEYYGIGLSKGRILFPDFDVDGDLVYWVSRAYDQSLPKYLNCPVSRERQIYNLGRWLNEKMDTITICEGPISAICAGRDAVATYGKLVSQTQIDLLRSLPAKRVYIALDPDARKEAVKLAKDLVNYFEELYLVPMAGKEDPASLGRQRFMEIKNLNSLHFMEGARDVPIRFLLGY